MKSYYVPLDPNNIFNSIQRVRLTQVKLIRNTNENTVDLQVCGVGIMQLELHIIYKIGAHNEGGLVWPIEGREMRTIDTDDTTCRSYQSVANIQGRTFTAHFIDVGEIYFVAVAILYEEELERYKANSELKCEETDFLRCALLQPDLP